jgi:hypothetical protein
MFWKKKQITTAPVIEGTAEAAGVAPSEKKVEVSPKKKAESAKAAKLLAPRQMPGMVEKYLAANYKMDAEIARLLKVVARRQPQTQGAFDCRVFDQSEAEAREIKIKDYTSLDEHPDLILYDGWFDEGSKRVELVEKRKLIYDVPLFTETEIRQKIEALNEPGSSVFFYQARGTAVGGPLGQGAVVVELNPGYSQKKGKKYNIYTANVIGMEPVAKRQKMFDSNQPKEIARWIGEAHHKRIY